MRADAPRTDCPQPPQSVRAEVPEMSVHDGTSMRQRLEDQFRREFFERRACDESGSRTKPCDAALIADGPTSIVGSDCVNISFPEFFDLMNSVVLR